MKHISEIIKCVREDITVEDKTLEEDAIKNALRRVMPGYGYNEEYSAWSSCVASIAKAFGYDHPNDEWFQFIHDCDPEETPDWKRGDKE